MMEMNLNRVDYMQVGTTNAKMMQLLPAQGGKKDQKIAVADQDGILQVFSRKKSETQHSFKTMPGARYSRLQLAGPVGQSKDRIFVSTGSEVRGYSKKGKQFLNFNTNLSQPIATMYVEGSDLFLCGDYVYNHYRDCKDMNYFVCPEKINDVVCLPSDKMNTMLPVLACQDRVLRVLQGSEMLYEVEVPGQPNVLCLYGNTGGDEGDEMLYGTADGKVGLVQLSKDEPAHKWELANDKRHGGVISLDNYDITSDGVIDLIVGRDDGNVEIYGYDEMDEPTLKHSVNCNESVTAVQGGVVSNPDYDEIVCSTYAGWVMSFTTEPIQRQMSQGVSRVQADESSQAKMMQLREEIEQLQRRVIVERERYQESAKSDKAISAVPQFSINDKFVLNRDDASYTLSLELQMPIDNVLLQSDVPVDLLEVDNNASVVSYSEAKPEDGNFLLATYRCQANTTRLELKIRSIEGQYGMLHVYITPRLQPKTCQMHTYQIKPLSLHQRTHTFDEERPYNSLKFTGNFSMAEMHSWVSFCLPELPERTPAGDSVTFHFVSSFLDTLLECTYRKGEAVFRSDNISTISILKDAFTKEATNKKIRLDMSYELNEESIPHTLRLIHPKLSYQLLLAKKVDLISALKELQVHETDLSFMSPEYQDILANSDKLQAEYKRQPCHLERLYGMVTDLYIDKFKFKGHNVKGRVQQLLEVLNDYELENLIDFFQQPLQ